MSFKIVDIINDKQNNSPVPNPTKPATIAFLGDSVTQGCFGCYKTQVDAIETDFCESEAYSEKLKKIIHNFYPRAQVNIINSGISGDRSSLGIKRLERDVLSYNPDLVVVCYGLNDCFEEKLRNELFENLPKIFDEIKSRGIDCIYMTPNMMCKYVSGRLFDKDLRKLAEDIMKIQNEGIFDKFIDDIKGICKEHDVPVCDAYSVWKKMDKNGADVTELLSNYLNHPTKEMHWLFAAMLFNKIFIED